MIFLGTLAGTIATGMVSEATGVEIGIFNFESLDDSGRDRLAWKYRLVNFNKHLMVFIIPAVVTMY